MDRDGNETELFTDPGLFHFPRPSPDGRSLLVSIHPSTGQLEHDLWLYDLTRKTRRRLTSGGDDYSVPVWGPRGRRIAFAVNAKRLSIVGVEGGAAVEVLASEDDELYMGSWSRDGRALAYTRNPTSMNSRRNIWIHTLDADGPGEVFLASEFDEDEPSFSRDGRWMAYRSDVSGQREVYAVSYPGKEETHAISRGGGTGPLWSSNGDELFYRDLDGTRMYAVSLEDGVFCEPRLLFEGEYSVYFATNYGVGPDGDMFYMVRSIVEPRLNVVVNWFDELRERVPTESPQGYR